MTRDTTLPRELLGVRPPVYPDIGLGPVSPTTTTSLGPTESHLVCLVGGRLLFPDLRGTTRYENVTGFCFKSFVKINVCRSLLFYKSLFTVFFSLFEFGTVDVL